MQWDKDDPVINNVSHKQNRQNGLQLSIFQMQTQMQMQMNPDWTPF